METFRLIEYQRQRDFSRKMNATFEFIKQNFKSLFRSILFISGPPVLIGSLLVSSFITDFIGLSQMAINDPIGYQEQVFAAGFWLKLLAMFAFVVICGLITLATINSYIVLYGEKKSNQIEVSEVWDRVRTTFWVYLVSMILFFILFFVSYVVLVIPIVLLGLVSTALVFFGISFVICAMVYLFISSSLLFIIQAYESKGFFQALGRSFRLVYGKWWSTFGLIMILYFIMVIVSYIPVLPVYAMMFAKEMHATEVNPFEAPTMGWRIIIAVLFTLYYLLQMFLSSLINVGIAFQYFNLVERKESKGLMSDIQTLGTTPEAPRPEEHY